LTGILKDEVIIFYDKFKKEFLYEVASKAQAILLHDKSLQEMKFTMFTMLTMARITNLGLNENIDREPKASQSISGDSKGLTLASSPEQEKELGNINKRQHLFSSPMNAFWERSNNDLCTEIEEMGIAAGGNIKQQLFQDTYGVESWDPNRRRSFKIHMVNSMDYKAITGQDPPPSPITIETYQNTGLPWFSHYDETAQSVKNAGSFGNLLGVEDIDKRRGMTRASSIPTIKIRPDVIRRIKTPDFNEATQAFRQRALADSEADRWQSALRQINYLIDLECEVDATDYALRSSCNYQLKRYIEGIIDGDKALELNPQCSSALSSRAFCRLAIGDFHGVKDDAEQLLKLPETELIGLELRAEASLRIGHYNDAVYDALYLRNRRPGYRRASEILFEARSRAHEQNGEERTE